MNFLSGHKTSEAEWDSKLINLLICPEYKWVRHLLLLSVSLVITYGNFYTEQDNVYWGFTASFLAILVPIYLNALVLVPRFLLKNHYLKYVASVFGVTSLAILLLLVASFVFHRDIPEMAANMYIFIFINLLSSFLLLILLMVSTSTAILFQHWFRYGQRIAELKNTTVASELEQLKNQINPHFLFNMLNNANVLVKDDPKEAVHILAKLNDLLKYQLKDTGSEKVFLQNDIRFLTDFLNLEKIRRDNFNFIISTEGLDDRITIPPFLFIPFVENAVKHNNDSGNMSYVYIRFVREGNRLHFNSVNSKPTNLEYKKEEGGIGLSNIQRRLELLYDDKYILDINDDEITYTINLYIPL